MGRVTHSLLAFTLAAYASATVVATDQPTDPPRNRYEFAEGMDELEDGMSDAEVLALLGRPDDVRTERDPDGISTVGTKVIWRYGTSGRLTTATLGQVYIDKDDRVQYLFGQGSPPPEGMFDERELRILLDALGQVPSYSSAWDYNPQKVIRAVNLLLPLGKEKALAAIDEFLRVTSVWHDEGREGVFLVLRTLFDVPDDPGYMPTMRVGAPMPSEPRDQKLLPRFPIAIEGDIPFLLVEGYRLTGYPEQPESHVAYFRKSGRMRDKPLAPSDHPFAELEEFATSPRWVYTGGLRDNQRGRQFLGQQLLRLLDNVYRVEPKVNGELLPFVFERAERRNQIVHEASNLEIHWDANAQKHTFVDGTSLPEIEGEIGRRR